MMIAIQKFCNIEYNSKIVKERLKINQLINNHYYLERKRDAQREWMKLRLVICSLVTCRKKVAIEEECLKQLYSVEGRKATNLERTKRRFNLVVKLIANKCYKDTFYFLSFLFIVLRLPSLALHIGLTVLHQIICRII